MTERIAVIGAGAIGAVIGAYLIREGYDVTLIDQWSAHVEKIKSQGLKVNDVKGEFTVKAKALHLSDVSHLREPFDIVFLCVKSYDTRWSTYLIEPFLKPTGFILPTQNSLNDEIVGSIVGFNRTIGCIPLVAGEVHDPGYVIRTDPMTTRCFDVGELIGLATTRVQKVVKTLQSVGPTELTTNIWGARWSKLVMNSMGSALAGIIGPAFASLDDRQQETFNLVSVVIGCEAARVGAALGVVLEPMFGLPPHYFTDVIDIGGARALKAKFEEEVRRHFPPERARRLGVPERPSLLQDVLKGRRTEIDYLNGLVVKKGQEAGVPTPVNQAITELMKEVEEGKVKPSLSNLERLKAYV